MEDEYTPTLKCVVCKKKDKKEDSLFCEKCSKKDFWVKFNAFKYSKEYRYGTKQNMPNHYGRTNETN